MTTDTRIKANTINNLLSVQTLAFCVSVQLIEVGNAQSQISICKKLNCLSLSKSHEQSVNVLFDCTFLEQTSKLMCRLHQAFITQVCTNDNTRRVQVIIKSLGFTQKLRTENDILAIELLAHRSSISNRNGGLDNHNGIRIIFHNQLNYCFNRRSIKVLSLAIIVGRSRDYNKVRIRVCSLCIQSCGQIQVFFCQVFFNIIILNRRFLVVNHIDLSLHNIDCNHLMMLAQKHSQRKPDVSRAGHSDFIVFHSSILPY